MSIGAVLNDWSLDVYASALPLCYTPRSLGRDGGGGGEGRAARGGPARLVRPSPHLLLDQGRQGDRTQGTQTGGPKYDNFCPSSFFKNDIFSPKHSENSPSLFVDLFPPNIRVLYNKSSYFFPNQPITHIFWRGQKEKYTTL